MKVFKHFNSSLAPLEPQFTPPLERRRVVVRGQQLIGCHFGVWLVSSGYDAVSIKPFLFLCAWFYLDRAACRDCHHRDFGRVALAGSGQGEGEGAIHRLPKQPQANRLGLHDVRG